MSTTALEVMEGEEDPPGAGRRQPGALVGIVAQADIARHESRKEVGELVRDVSSQP